MLKMYYSTWRRLGDYRGFSGRKEFWVFYLSLMIVFWGGNRIENQTVGVVATLYCMFALIPMIPLLIRRLRDAGFHWAWAPLVFVPVAAIVPLVLAGLNTKNEGNKYRYPYTTMMKKKTDSENKSEGSELDA